MRVAVMHLPFILPVMSGGRSQPRIAADCNLPASSVTAALEPGVVPLPSCFVSVGPLAALQAVSWLSLAWLRWRMSACLLASKTAQASAVSAAGDRL